MKHPNVRNYVSDRVFEGKRPLSEDQRHRLERLVKESMARFPKVYAKLKEIEREDDERRAASLPRSDSSVGPEGGNDDS